MTTDSSKLIQFVERYPNLYQRLCFWADKRGVIRPVEQVQEYLTELVVDAIPQPDQAMILQKWLNVLSLQERVAVSALSPIHIALYPNSQHWYIFQAGEYSVMNEPVLDEIVYAGKRQGIITRNRYGCLVLNCVAFGTAKLLAC